MTKRIKIIERAKKLLNRESPQIVMIQPEEEGTLKKEPNTIYIKILPNKIEGK